MRKRIFGRRFKRDTNERKALFRSLMHGVVLHGKIRTTEAKAKAIKGDLEKFVTAAKTSGKEARTHLVSRLANERVVDKIINEIAPRMANRPGGYLRILRLAPRVADGARQVMLTWVEEIVPTSFEKTKRRAQKPKEQTKVKVPEKPKAKEKSKRVSKK